MTLRSVIHRVAVPVTTTQVLELAGYAMGGALHVAPARDGTHNIELWYRAWIDDNEEYKREIEAPRRVAIHIDGTGHPYTHAGDHVGTVIIGPYVWHVFAEYPIRGER